MSYIGNIPVTGDNNSFKLLDDITSHTLTFDGSSTSVVSTADNTISSTDHRFLTGQRVTYNDGGGTAITGLSDGVYYIIKHSQNTIQLAANASDAALGTDINLAGVGAGTAHTLNVAFDGVNTNFRATFDSGIKAGITRAAQLQISINGVIQQPQDTATPTTGFGIDVDSIIAFSTAPVSTDVFWGSLVAKNFPTFDISNNDTDTFTGDNSTVSFTLSKDSKDARNILVTLDGVVQYPSSPGVVRAYDVSQNVLSFASAPGLGVDISVRHIGFAGPSNITKNTIGITSAGTTIDTDAQTLNFTGPEFDVTSSGTTADIGLTGTFAGDISIADKIIHTGDTNTAIRFPAADTFTVETGGSERLRVDSAGDVGIGQNDPTKKLEVAAGAVSFSPDTAGKHTHEFTTNASNDARYLLRSDTTTKVDIQANGVTYFNGGNVVVNGTATGSNAKFEVQSTTGSISSATLRVSAEKTTTGAINTGSTILLAGHDGGNSRDFGSIFAGKENGTGSNYAAYLAFGTRANGSTMAERLRITSAGLFGFHTTSPDAEVHIEPVSTNASIILSNDGRTQYFRIQNNETDDALVFNANDSNERLRITSGGTALFKGGLAEKYENAGTTLGAQTANPLSDGNVILFTGNEAGDMTINFTGVHATISNGETVSFTVILTPNNSGKIGAVWVDGQVPGGGLYWSGGSAPSAGASGQDIYTFQILKTGTGVSNYTIFGAAANYATV